MNFIENLTNTGWKNKVKVSDSTDRMVYYATLNNAITPISDYIYFVKG
jgi:hypothetical protein